MHVEHPPVVRDQPEPAPPARPRRVLGTPLVVDILLVLSTAVVGAIGVGVEMQAAGQRLPWQVGGYTLAVLAGCALFLRRRSPVGTVVAILVVSACYHALGYPGLAPATAMFVGFYLLAAYGPSRRSLLVGGGIALLVNVVPLLPPHAVPFGVATTLGPAIGMIAAGAAGDAIRSRRLTTEEQLRSMRKANLDDIQRRIAEERLSIARELHDVLAHTITVISVQAAVGDDLLDNRPEAVRAALITIRDSAKEAMSELRSTLQVLRDNPTDTPQAPQPRLEQLPALVELARASGVDTHLVVEGKPGHVPTAVGIAAYRIVQESLTNVARHAANGSATVRLDYQPGALVIEITDDGGAPGPPDPDRPRGTGHGLTGMRERARAVGGFVEAGPGSVAGGGFAVRSWLPTGEEQ